MSESTLKLVGLAVGVWITFTVFGMATEALTSTEYGDKKERFSFTWSLVLIQATGNTLVAALVLKLTGASSLNGGVKCTDWMIAGAAYLGAHKFGLLSLHYIIFPMQVLVKSCKAIPVMFGEVMFESHVQLTMTKLVSVMMLCAGVVVFTFGKGSKKGERFELDQKMVIGLGFVLCALFCDGIYGPYQNKLKTKAGKQLTGYHNMLNMNFWQGIYALIFCLAAGELPLVLDFIARNPAVTFDLVKFGIAMSMGQVCIFQMQSSFGALTVTKTTTVRKLISVLCSVWYFGHSLKPMQWAGVAMVFMSEPVGKMFAPKGDGKTKAQ